MHIDPDLPSAPSGPRPRGPSGKLRDALHRLAGGRARIVRHNERSWASITFAGTRHSFTLSFEGTEAVEAGETFIAVLPDHEFTLRRHLVADAAVTAVDHRADPPRMDISVEMLLLEED